jgi:hypothetical protein
MRAKILGLRPGLADGQNGILADMRVRREDREAARDRLTSEHLVEGIFV